MANAWLAHVKATMKKHKGMKFKQVLKEAKKTYKSNKSHKSRKSHKKTRKSRKGKIRSKRR